MRRHWILFALFLGIGLALAIRAPAEARDTLRVGTSSLPPGLGNPYTASGPPSFPVWHVVFDTLVGFDGDGTMVPRLALGWENETPTRWVFRLRPDVMFSNGEVFDAAAAKATLDYLRSPEGSAMMVSGELAGVTAVEVVDPLTLAIETAEPDAILANRMGMLFIVAPGAWAELGPEAFARNPVGTGSYTITNWSGGGGRLNFTANPTSWRPPEIANLEMFELPDVAGRMQALLSGQVDIAVGMGPEEAAIIGPRGFVNHEQGGGQILSLAIHTVDNLNPALDDVRVRQALNHAIDKQALVEGILLGYGSAASQGSTPNIFGHNDALEPYAYDPARARQLLTEAGYPDGLELQAMVMVNMAAGDALIFQKVQQDLAAIGVDLELQATVFPAWLRNYTAGAWGETDLFSLTWNTSAYFDVQRPMEYFSCLKPNPFFCEPDLVPLVEAAGQETDREARRALLADLHLRVREAAPAIFLVEVPTIFSHVPSLEGFRLMGSGIAFDEMRFR